jgi:hypothetical protein
MINIPALLLSVPVFGKRFWRPFVNPVIDGHRRSERKQDSEDLDSERDRGEAPRGLIQVHEFLNEKVKADFEALKKVRDGGIAGISTNLDDSKWVVTFVSDNAPVYWYLYDRGSKQAALLFNLATGRR